MVGKKFRVIVCPYEEELYKFTWHNPRWEIFRAYDLRYKNHSLYQAVYALHQDERGYCLYQLFKNFKDHDSDYYQYSAVEVTALCPRGWLPKNILGRMSYAPIGAFLRSIEVEKLTQEFCFLRHIAKEELETVRYSPDIKSQQTNPIESYISPFTGLLK